MRQKRGTGPRVPGSNPRSGGAPPASASRKNCTAAINGDVGVCQAICLFTPVPPIVYSSNWLAWKDTIDSPQIGHAPDPGKPVALRTCPISGPHVIGFFLGVAARPPPQRPVTLRTCSMGVDL
jgi:hypothetical protein